MNRKCPIMINGIIFDHIIYGYPRATEYVLGNHDYVAYINPKEERFLLHEYTQLFPEKTTRLQPDFYGKEGAFIARKLFPLVDDHPNFYDICSEINRAKATNSYYYNINGLQEVEYNDVFFDFVPEKFQECIMQGINFFLWVQTKATKFDIDSNSHNFMQDADGEIYWIDPIYE